MIETADGREAEIWALQHADDPAILSAWATHYRQHYCRDEDLPDLVADTGLSNADFLANIKFPDPVAAPGPSTRAGDFGEILVADFIEYVLGYWCPRQGRFEDRENRNVPSNGTDVIGFSFAGDQPSPDDELLVIEFESRISADDKKPAATGDQRFGQGPCSRSDVFERNQAATSQDQPRRRIEGWAFSEPGRQAVQAKQCRSRRAGR